MIYLVLMVVVAAIGIGTLVWQQRRQQAHMDSVAGFNQALRAISPETRGPMRRSTRPARKPGPRNTHGRPVPLDPKQRAEARRRLEQRRRVDAHRRAAAARVADERYGS